MNSHRLPRRADGRRAAQRTTRLRLEVLEGRWVPAQTAVLFKDINTVNRPPLQVGGPSSNPTELTDVNGRLYFSASDGTSGMELWRSEGTPETTFRVKDIRIGAAGSNPQRLTAVGDILYFTADQGNSGRRLWRTDGTEAGTYRVLDAFGGLYDYFDIGEMISFDDHLFLTANAYNMSTLTGRELLEVMPDSLGNDVIYPFLSLPGTDAVSPAELTVVPNPNGAARLYFAGNTPHDGRELWRTDGTSTGTSIDDVNPYWGSNWPLGNDRWPLSSNPEHLGVCGTSLFFSASYDLWRTDCSREQAELWSRDPIDSEQFTEVNGEILFAADGSGGKELWKTSLTSPGAARVKDIRSGWQGSYPNDLVNVGGTLYFTANDNISGIELWRSDGTAAGTTMVKNIRRNLASSAPAELTSLSGRLYFTANDGTSGREVWISDGTDAGTRILSNIHTGFLHGSSPSGLMVFNGLLFFAANNGRIGNELWRSSENQPHTVTRPTDQSNAEGDAVSLAVQVDNPDGDHLTFSAAGLPDGLAINPTTGLISGTIGVHAGVPQRYEVTITVSDGFQAPQTTFFWSVSDNTVPAIENPGPQGNNEGNDISLTISAADPTADRLTFSATGLPPGLTIGRIDRVAGFDIVGQVGPQAASNSPYMVTVTASDGTNTVSTTFPWTIGDITAPIITNPGTQRKNEGNNIALRIRAIDVEGDPLAFTADGLPPELAIDSTGTIAGRLSNGAAGNYQVTVTASDGQNSASTTFTWVVGDITTPTLQHPGTQNAIAGSAVSLQIVATDADRDALTYTALGLPQGLSISPDTGLISGTIAIDADGSFNVTIRATDGTSHGQTSFVWNVEGLPHGGQLDPTFDDDGLATTAFGPYLDRAQATVVQRDGKVIAAGFTTDFIDGFHTGIALARYTEDGRLDDTFGSAGKVVTSLSREDQAQAVLLQGDQILVAGFTTGATRNVVVLRYNADGRIDTTFGAGGNGRIILDFGGTDTAAALVLQDDGMIVVGGTTAGPGVSDFALARLTADGKLDSEFGSAGKVITDLAGGMDVLTGLALQPDRAIVAVGSARVAGVNQFAAVRYLADGTLDQTFGMDSGSGRTGKAFVPVGQDSGGAAVAVRADGRLILGGNSYDTATGASFTVLRLMANGDLDGSFGTSGVTMTSLAGPNEVARAMSVQSDGKIILAGRADGPGGADFALVRYTANGQLDTGFDFDGVVTTDFGFDGSDDLYGVALNGTRLVAVGSATNGSDAGDFAVARYLL